MPPWAPVAAVSFTVPLVVSTIVPSATLVAALRATKLVAAGCSSGGSGGGSGSGPVTLTITGDYGGTSFDVTDNWWKAAAAAFKKTHPNVTVKIQNIVTTSESTYYAKLDLLERSSATSPNIVYEDSFLVKSDAAAGYLAPLPLDVLAPPNQLMSLFISVGLETCGDLARLSRESV